MNRFILAASFEAISGEFFLNCEQTFSFTFAGVQSMAQIFKLLGSHSDL